MLSRGRAAVISTVLLLVFLSGDITAQREGLFAAIAPAQTQRLDGLAAGETPGVTTIRSRLVRIDVDRLARARGDVNAPDGAQNADVTTLVLNLFEDVVLSGIVEHTNETVSGAGYVLSGRLDDDELGTMTLLVYEEGVVGTVRTPTTDYNIRPLGDGVHAISQLDTSMLPPESDPLLPPFPSSDAESGRPIADPPTPAADDGSVIDVAVFYTRAAAARAPSEMGITGIRGLVDLMVANANISYRESGVIQRIRSVSLQQVNDYNRSGEVDSSDALKALTRKIRGVFRFRYRHKSPRVVQVQC